MDFKPMFPSLNVLWTRWSAYQIKPHQWGGEYLIPAEGATDLTYNCAEQPGPLVADALELGRQLHMEHRTKTACVPLLRPATGSWA